MKSNVGELSEDRRGGGGVREGEAVVTEGLVGREVGEDRNAGKGEGGGIRGEDEMTDEG